jgi:hypothetical protein
MLVELLIDYVPQSTVYVLVLIMVHVYISMYAQNIQNGPPSIAYTNMNRR